MILDVLLPSVLFLIAVAVVFLQARFEKKVDSLFGGKEFHIGHAVLLVVAIGILVSVLVFVPESAMLVFFLFAYSTILFLFTYLLVPKWYLAISTPVLFIALYLSPYWKGNIYLFNLFAIIFAVCISVYMGSLFTWKTTAAFVALLTVMDVIQVLITKHMVTSSEKGIALGLPVAIILPTFPYESWSILGLGDVFLFGLLSIQTTRKYGRNFGLVSIVSVTLVFSLLQTILLNTGAENFPATVMVVSGWLTALAARYLYKSQMFR